MNFLVWRRGLRGPIASLDLIDPRQMSDWPQAKSQSIAIIPLVDHEQDMSLDTLIALRPCPEFDA